MPLNRQEKMPRTRLWRYIGLSIWVIFTVALCVWWIYFGMHQIARLSELGYTRTDETVRFQKMLLWEGATLVLSLLLGGWAIWYFMYRELKQGEELKRFFFSFSHELKTALAAVSLQAEMIAEKLQSPSDAALVERFLADTQKLTLQLENSLALANLDSRDQHLESVGINSVIESLRFRYPGLAISLKGDASVKSDIRALEGILSNLCQNALVHGNAKNLTVHVTQAGKQVNLMITDDGRGMQGDRTLLGQRFARPYSGSGSGLGLHISSELARRMGGRLTFPESHSGFAAQLEFEAG